MVLNGIYIFGGKDENGLVQNKLRYLKKNSHFVKVIFILKNYNNIIKVNINYKISIFLIIILINKT